MIVAGKKYLIGSNQIPMDDNFKNGTESQKAEAQKVVDALGDKRGRPVTSDGPLLRLRNYASITFAAIVSLSASLRLPLSLHLK